MSYKCGYDIIKTIDFLLNSSPLIHVFSEHLHDTIFIFTDTSLKTKYVYCKSISNSEEIECSIPNFSEEYAGKNAFSQCSYIKLGICLEKDCSSNAILNKYYSAAYPVAEQNGRILGFIGLFSKHKLDRFLSIIFLELLAKLLVIEMHKGILAERIESPFKIGCEMQKELEQSGLTNRECEILELVINSSTDVEICEKLHISLSTVRAHINSIFKKTNINSKRDLICLLYKSNLECLKQEIINI